MEYNVFFTLFALSRGVNIPENALRILLLR